MVTNNNQHARRKLLIGTLAGMLFAAAAPGANAHAKIAQAEPKPQSELSASPKEIRLRYNEALEPAFSKIELVDAGQKLVALPKAKVDSAEPAVMHVALPALKPGAYRVRWAAMTHDGHKVKGEYSFTVSAAR